MSSGLLANAPAIAITAEFGSPIVNLQQDDLGFIFNVQRSFWIPKSASFFIIWQVVYPDGNRGTQNWHYIDFSANSDVSFEYSIGLNNQPGLLSSLGLRLLIMKVYLRRWVFAYDETLLGDTRNYKASFCGRVKCVSFKG